MTEQTLEEFMNEPKQRQTEVIVGHRIGFWMGSDMDDVTTEMIQEADDYLEAYVQDRINGVL